MITNLKISQLTNKTMTAYQSQTNSFNIFLTLRLKYNYRIQYSGE